MGNWADIEADPSYQAMKPREKARTRQMYLTNVIAKDPSYRALPDAGKKEVIAKFLGIQQGDSQTHYTLRQAANAAVHNIAKDAETFGKGVKNTIVHPQDTFHAAMAAGKGLPDAMQLNDKTARSVVHAAAALPGGVGDYAGTRYGSADAIKRTIAEHPVQMLADASTLLTAGAGGVGMVAGPVRMANTLSAPARTAQALRTAAAYTNPLNVVNAPTRITNAIAGTRFNTPAQFISNTALKASNARNPQHRVTLEMANGKGPQIVKKLDEAVAHPIIPGSIPTAAEAIEPNPLRAGVTPTAAAPSNALIGPGSSVTLQLPAGGNTPSMNLLPDAPNPTRQLPGGPAPTPLLPAGPAAEVLDAAPSIDSLLLDGHSLDAITAPRPAAPGGSVPPAAVLLDEAAAAPVRPTNAMNRNTPPGAAPGEAPGAPPTMNNALNQARPVEPEAPPRQAPQQEAPAPEPEATPQPEPTLEAPLEAPPVEPVVPASDFDFMGRTKEVQQFIDQHPHMEAMFQKAVTKSEKDIAKAEAGLLASSKYGQKFIDIAKMKNLSQQEAAFKSWIEDEANPEEITRLYGTLKKSTLTAEAAKRRIAELPKELEGYHSILDQLLRGEEGHMDINAIADAINKKIMDYHAKNAAAGVVTLAPHPGVGVRGVPRPGSPGVVATKFSAGGSAAELNNSDNFTELYNRNNAARMKVNNETGKTGPAGNVDRPTAEAQHDALASVEYGRAGSKLSTADATFHNITHRPLSDSVMERARKYLGEGNEAFQIGSYVPAHIDAAGNRVAAVYPKYSGRALQAIKQAFDDLAFDPKVIEHGGLSDASVRQIQKTRAEFLRWVGLRGNNPELITAMKNYATRENQIARMKFAEHVESILQKPISDEYTLRQRASAFADAMKPANEAKTLLAATKRHMHTKFSDLLTPKEIENYQAIKDDLTREALAKDHAHAGRKSNDIINNAASDGIGTTHIPGKGGMINNLKEMLTKDSDARVMADTSKAMETPQGAREMMSNALKWETKRDKRRDLAGKVNAFINGPKGINAYPTLYNSLADQRDKKEKAK